MKRIILLIFVLFILVGGYFASNYQPAGTASTPAETKPVYDTKNISFTIDGETISLVDGVSSAPLMAGSETLRTVNYIGDALSHDIDGDGDLDAVFLVSENSGGSGTFYYAVGAINEPTGYVATEALIVGDRISPQSVAAGEGSLVLVNYKDRNFDDPMTVEPAVDKVLQLKYSTEDNKFDKYVYFKDEILYLQEGVQTVRVLSPEAGSSVFSPVVLSGEARGSWFFEGSFPVSIVDAEGAVLGEGFVTANADWMTNDFVPFVGLVEYKLDASVGSSTPGSVVLRKDNPSGLPEHDDSFEVNVVLNSSFAE